MDEDFEFLNEVSIDDIPLPEGYVYDSRAFPRRIIRLYQASYDTDICKDKEESGTKDKPM